MLGCAAWGKTSIKCTDLAESWRWYLAVKPIVEPGNDWSKNEHGDATVVETAEEAGDFFRVTGEGVEESGAPHAQDGADEEAEENELVERMDVLKTVVLVKTWKWLGLSLNEAQLSLLVLENLKSLLI